MRETNVLDNLKNFVARLIYEEDITMFTHNLNDEGGLNIVPNLILVRNSDFNDSIVFNLLDRLDNSTL